MDVPVLRLADGSAVEVLRDTLVVGRDPECDLVLVDPHVSRRHAVIERQGLGWVVRDTGSANSTFAENHAIESHPLWPGLRLRFATTSVRVEMGEAGAITPSPRLRARRSEPRAEPGPVPPPGLEGRFTDVEPVGRGTIADHFRARRSSDGETVFVKLLRDPGAVGGLHAEALALRAIARAAPATRVPRLRDVGDSQGRSFLSMSLLEGYSLRDLERPWSFLRLLAVVEGCLQSLSELHAAGFVHGGLSTRTVFLRRVESDATVVPDDEVWLVGLRNARRSEGGGDPPSSPAADVFAMGLICYELISGAAPERRAGEVMPLGLVADVPEMVEHFVSGLLAANPSQRPTAARALVELRQASGLGRWLGGVMPRPHQTGRT